MTCLRRMAVALTLCLCASLTPPSLAYAASTCLGAADADTSAIWPIAQTRLLDLATGAGIPFGATGRSTYRRTDVHSWTAGFYPTSLWLLYGHTRDGHVLDTARAYTDRLLPVAGWTGTHDLGFMIGLPTLTAEEFEPDPDRRAAYAAAALTAARTLAKRWNGRVGAMKSAEYAGQWGLIIDSAMNAPLLISEGARIGGAEGRHLVSIGTTHMLTLARDLLRPNGSTLHRVAYDPGTGNVLGAIPGQGLRTSSTWARGQAWAVNGFAAAYGLTLDPRLLDAARRSADYWMSHVQSGCVPAWDLDISSWKAPRDTSAAAIVADGLLRLSQVDPDATRAAAYHDYAVATLRVLSRPAWTPSMAGVRGLLQHQAYNIPADRREGTYVWGDAYLLSALSTSG